ncbi:hypothetical protein [Endozoicomonas elysicola]|uniref:Uncharacterized protein n=1 Tax=Endozoicomonas elysicola TaxID=305900 RepID=A0A081KFX5_9GAMM|nr:hypothetical protein [Endozoicomonas elysicola]KEI73051.1 hypothetical protein GV64_22105 [Endozoicomonas elysicola]
MANVQNTQNLATTYPQAAHQQDNVTDDFGKCFRRMVRPLERKYEDSKPKTTGVIIAGQNADEDKLAKSHMGYLKHKTDGMQDYKKALDPIAQTKWERFKSGAGKVFKTLKDWAIKVVKFVYRYTGLEFIVNAIKNKVAPKVDMHHAKKAAKQEGRAGMLEELKKEQGIRGIAAPITPRTTVSSPCSGQKDYDLSAFGPEKNCALEHIANRQGAADLRDKEALLAIKDIEEKREEAQAKLLKDIFDNRTAEEDANTQVNVFMADFTKQKAAKDGTAHYVAVKETPSTMLKAKAWMDRKMAERKAKIDARNALSKAQIEELKAQKRSELEPLLQESEEEAQLDEVRADLAQLKEASTELALKANEIVARQAKKDQQVSDDVFANAPFRKPRKKHVQFQEDASGVDAFGMKPFSQVLKSDTTTLVRVDGQQLDAPPVPPRKDLEEKAKKASKFQALKDLVKRTKYTQPEMSPADKFLEDAQAEARAKSKLYEEQRAGLKKVDVKAPTGKLVDI